MRCRGGRLQGTVRRKVDVRRGIVRCRVGMRQGMVREIRETDAETDGQIDRQVGV